MADRLSNEELEKIKSDYNVDRLWSWSRMNCYQNSKYEYFLKYIARKPEDRQDCSYGTMGGICHDVLGNYYEGRIEYKDMINDFEDGWLTAIDIADLKFDRNDSEKNALISKKYKENLSEFFKNHMPYEYKLAIEKPVTIKMGDYAFVGYIDAIHKDNDGVFHITDFKTSTIYKGEKLIHNSGQLVLYAIGIHQMGIPYENIRINFNFLKYVNVDCQQANGKWTTRQIERREIGDKLQTSAKMWLKKLGYEDELLEYLDKLSQTNDIKCLPDDVQEKFKISDCLVYIPITNELINDWSTEIINTLDEIMKKEAEYKSCMDEKVFFDTPEEVEKQSYYFATLSGYSANLHKPYGLYLDKLKAENEGDILGTVSNNSQTKTENNDSGEDMSWLNLL